MIVTVTGASGFVGEHLVRMLSDRGSEVRALSRSPGPAIAGRERKVVDVLDSDAIERALIGSDVVFHLAARLHTDHPTTAEAQRTNDVNIAGTRNVAAALGSARLVMFSTISVYGPSRGGPPHTEESALAPATEYARSKVAAEEITRGVGATNLRLAAVYGPGMKGNYPRLVRAISRQRFPLLGGGLNRRTIVHVDDVCRAALAAAECDAGTYNVTDGSVHTLREITEAIALALGVAPPRLRIPIGPARGAARAADGAARVLGRRVAIAETLNKLVEDVAVSGDLLRKDSGYRPEVDLAAGWPTVTGLELW